MKNEGALLSIKRIYYRGKLNSCNYTLAVLEDLKRQGLKVVPLCRFMARYILRHPEWKQMVADK